MTFNKGDFVLDTLGGVYAIVIDPTHTIDLNSAGVDVGGPTIYTQDGRTYARSASILKHASKFWNNAIYKKLCKDLGI